LILPESIKTLPLLVQALYKRDALRQGQLRVDGRIFDIHLLMTASCNVVHNYLYPKMFPLHDLADTFVSNEYQLGVLLEENKVVMP
jgi:protein transport protein SEC24